MRSYLLIFLLSLIISYLLTPIVRGWSQRLLGRRRMHENDVGIPRLGGIAVVTASLAAWAILLLIPSGVARTLRADLMVLLTMFIPGGLVLLIGIYDDIWGATPRQKLAVQILAALLAYFAGFRILGLPVLHIHRLEMWYLSLPITVLWIVGLTNAFNLIDGMDGLAAGLGFFVALAVFFVSLLSPNPFGGAISIGLAGALVGFLRYNFNPATIYLGDSGSLFLGFIFANLAIYGSQKSSTMVAVTVPILVFGLPVLDTGLAIVRRALSGNSIFERDEDHIHHRLLKRGFSVRLAVLILYGLGALFAFGSLVIFTAGGPALALAALLVGVASWFIIQQLNYDEFTELNVYVGRALRSQRRVLANQILIRRGGAELGQAESADDLWNRLTSVLERLDFDTASCQFTADSATRRAFEKSWSVNGDNRWPKGKELHWVARLPLSVHDSPAGFLEVSRSRAKGRLLFQFSSLVDTLVPAFEQRLLYLTQGLAAEREAPHQRSQEVSQNTQHDPARQVEVDSHNSMAVGKQRLGGRRI